MLCISDKIENTKINSKNFEKLLDKMGCVRYNKEADFGGAGIATDHMAA